MSLLKFVALAAALNCCLFVLAEPASAQVIFPDFELEGNAVDDSGAGIPDDWENIWNETSDANASVFLSEQFEGKGVDISYFTSGGSKDNQDISAWKITSNSAPDKNQMQNAYAAAYLCPLGGRPDCDEDDLIVYLGADRYATAGDAQMGFWILRDQVSADITGTKTFLNQFGDPAEHKDGDLLVQTDFTQGGTEFTIRVYFWDGDGMFKLSRKYLLTCQRRPVLKSILPSPISSLWILAPIPSWPNWAGKLWKTICSCLSCLCP